MDRTQCIRSAAAAAALLLTGTPAVQAGPGELDVRFGTHGQAAVPAQQTSGAILALPDGRILIFGVPDATPSKPAIAVARLLADGSPDNSFGPGGHILVPISGESHPFPADSLLLDDGRILVAGSFMSEIGDWGDQSRLPVPGWIVRLTADGAIDPTFGISGVARAGPSGIDRFVRLADGGMAVAAPGMVQRLEPNGAPAYFPGSEASTSVTGSGTYAASALLLMGDGSLITSAGYWEELELSRVATSGMVSRTWGSVAAKEFTWIAALARNAGDTRVTACGSWMDIARVERWQDDGSPHRPGDRTARGIPFAELRKTLLAPG